MVKLVIERLFSNERPEARTGLWFDRVGRNIQNITVFNVLSFVLARDFRVRAFSVSLRKIAEIAPIGRSSENLSRSKVDVTRSKKQNHRK